jgi:integrase/recombinase XerD
MLMTSVKRYIALRRKLGYGLLQADRLLKAYAQFAKGQGDTHVRVSTAVAWATAASTPGTRYVRLNAVVLLARFLRAEDAGHEVPPSHLFPPPQGRLMPYIYSADELSRIVAAAAKLPRTYALRRATYATLFGLIASTGLRISEALNLRLSDVQPDGVLLIRRGKGGKSRLIPLHSTVVAALNDYLASRLNFPTVDDHLFVSARTRGISRSMANYTFRRLALHAGINQTGTRPCRIHDLRHTFATRSLEKCPTRREDVAAHFVALATYLGHVDITHTYWYLEATPELMTDIAASAEALVGKEVA